jgi:acyl-CoA thioesterase-1
MRFVRQVAVLPILSARRSGLALLLTCLALAGCKAQHNDSLMAGTERGSMESPHTMNMPSKPDVAAAPAVQDSRTVIVCFGDSLTAGFGTDPGQSYPDYLQHLLDTAGYKYRVVNAGISGNTSKDGLDRVAHVSSLHPEVVVVEFGGNDGLRGLPLEQTQKNIAAIIESLQKSGQKVALAGITLPPDYGQDYIAKFNTMYSALAKQYRVPLLPFLLQGVYGVSGSMQDDSTHATAQGNRQVAANVEKLILPMLKK